MKKVAIITGVAGGIGQAIANHFLEKSYSIIGLDCLPKSDLDLPENDFQYFQVDLGNPIELTDVIKQILQKISRVDVLINNAAIQICKPISNTTNEDWDHLMNINLKAAFVLCRDFYPVLKVNSGSIVNISSVHSLLTSPNIGVYATSKGALSAMTRSLAIEFAPDVRVNSIAPGAIYTAMLHSGLKRDLESPDNLDLPNQIEEKLHQLAEKTPLKRIGKTQDIAKSVYFLADSEFSGFITGHLLSVDGGVTAKLCTE